MGLEPAADSPPPFEAVSLAADLFCSPAAAPPEELASFEDAPLEDDSLLPPLPAASPLEDEPSPLVLLALVVLADLVEVEVVCTAASALVLVGGVMSGVLFGTASETLLPPHAPSVSPHTTAAHAATATRAFTAGPCACRRWGSR